MIRRERGLTLVVTLVMLVVLTLLVVSAIRFSNINLRIAGNMQAETEAVAAAQVAVEQTVKTMSVAATAIPAMPQPLPVQVSTGGLSYKVEVSKPACVFNKPLSNSDLDPSKAGDLVCYESSDPEKLVTAEGGLSIAPTGCKDRQWEVTAKVDDGILATNGSGAAVNVLQGIAERVGAEVQCP